MATEIDRKLKAADSNPDAPEKKLPKTGEGEEEPPGWVKRQMNKMGDVEN